MFFSDKRKLIILDDDPTGMQTVHDCLALTRWEQADLLFALSDEVHFFFLLTNTRALSRDKARQVIQQAVKNVMEAARLLNVETLFLFRSDSTLRGHFPLELDTIIKTSHLHYDARFFIPAFFEGNRVTDNDTHYIKLNEGLIPCDETEFSQDSVFGYSDAYLPKYIQEKSGKTIQAESVVSIKREMLDGSHNDPLHQTLQELKENQYVIVNCLNYKELNCFFISATEAMKLGKHFIFQTAASAVKSFTQCDDIPPVVIKNSNSAPGLIIVGSHVTKTTKQLKILQQEGQNLAPIEIDAQLVLHDSDTYFEQIIKQAESDFLKGLNPLLYTSRRELSFPSIDKRQEAGMYISNFLTKIINDFPRKPAFVIAKGGITSHDILAKGLKVPISRVLGQASPGVPILKMPSEHRWSGMVYVIFPGNIGEDDTLKKVYQAITG
ncbi:MAG: four-carbon acid sugar kinase family protein [Deltaproteobacteria bacterium]|nr:four-carbon acid sugar kinase family protein [Deltaproteobacteria bacterium]